MIVVFTLVNLLSIAFVSRWMWKRLAMSDSQVFWSALTFRLASGIGVGLLYAYYYHGGDTFSLYEDAIGMSQPATSEPRSLFFIYVLRGISVVTGKNYWLTSLWLSLFSFISSYRLTTRIIEIFPSTRIASRIALLFWPSVVFWTSGVIKESLAFGAVMILSLYFLAFMNDEKLTLRSSVEIILALILLLTLKYYWGAVLIPSLVTAIIIKRIVPKRFFLAWYLVVFVALCLAASFMHPNFYLDRFVYVLVENHDIYVLRYPNNLIHYYNLTPEWISLLMNSPLALWSGLFRPTILEISSIPEALAAMENLALFVLTVWTIVSIIYRRTSHLAPAAPNRLLVATVVIYIVVLCIFLALSTPNLGTLSRYRVGFLPFFVLLILLNHPILNLINGKSSHHIRR